MCQAVLRRDFKFDAYTPMRRTDVTFTIRMNEVVSVFADRRQAIAAVNADVEHVLDAVANACEGTIFKEIHYFGIVIGRDLL